MKKTVSLMLALIATLSLCFSLTACASKNDLIGTWEISRPQTSKTWEFVINEDGSALFAGVTSYAWEYNKKDRCFYIWANFPGAYAPALGLPIIKQRVHFSKDKKSFTLTHEGDRDTNCFRPEEVFTRIE